MTLGRISGTLPAAGVLSLDSLPVPLDERSRPLHPSSVSLLGPAWRGGGADRIADDQPMHEMWAGLLDERMLSAVRVVGVLVGIAGTFITAPDATRAVMNAAWATTVRA